ncbi:hypothetical protein T484DRAFT_2283030 [Baffinella frigidus]|nr:hypothetical protein T484DRAFT_2283030 [Cryptophyta sp. CCMP2293]
MQAVIQHLLETVDRAGPSRHLLNLDEHAAAAAAAADTPAETSDERENLIAWGMFWGILSAVSLPIGALVGITLDVSERFRSTMMAFGAGALLYALTLELFGQLVSEKAHLEPEVYTRLVLVMSGSALGGGLFFSALDAVLNNFGAFMRKASTLSAPSTKAFLGRMISGQTIKCLGRHPLFRDVPEEALLHLLGRMQKMSFDRGQEICNVLDHEDPFIFYVISGMVRLDFVREDGSKHERERREIGPESIFGHEALSVDGNVRVQAEAALRTVVLRIASDDLITAFNQRANQLAQEDPHDRSALQRMVRVFETVPADSVMGAHPSDLNVNAVLASLSPEQRSMLHGEMMQENFHAGETYSRIPKTLNPER